MDDKHIHNHEDNVQMINTQIINNNVFVINSLKNQNVY